MEKLILRFHEMNKKFLAQVGGKGANLGEMTMAGLPVPQGFCVTTAAFSNFIQNGTRMNDFYHALEDIQATDLDGIRILGQKIRNHLESLNIPEQIETAILEAWRECGEEKGYAVRSSATAEDLPTASFAGQQETYLNIRGQNSLLDAVKRCFASLFTDRAIAYRAKNGFDHRSVLLSVVVQEMVYPEVSGIMFTADPVTGNRHVVSIDASFGLGEALVSGLVSADLYQVRESNIIQKKIAKKKLAIFSVPEGGTITEDLPLERQEVQALPDELIVELANLGKKIETHYGLEQDIEWCYANGKFYIVQSRPITSLYPVPKSIDDRTHVYFSLGHLQMMTNVMSPLAISVFRTIVPFGKEKSGDTESVLAAEAGGRLFFDLTYLTNLKPARKILPLVLKNMDEKIGYALIEVFERPEFQYSASRQLKKRALHVVLPMITNVLLNVWVRNPKNAFQKVNQLMKDSVQECEAEIFSAHGEERILRIQNHVSHVLLSLLQKVAPYFVAGMASMKMMEALFKRWFGDVSKLDILNKSLIGNVTTEMGLRLGDVADVAREYPGIVAYLQDVDSKPTLDGIQSIKGGKEFLREFNAFLQLYGMRCPGEIDIQSTRWRESPMTLAPAMMSHIRTHVPREHREKFEQGKKEADAATKQIIALVRESRGPIHAKVISRLIHVFRNLAGLREHHKYMVIQYMDIYKRAILEEARILVQKGVLDNEEDVFLISLTELSGIIRGAFRGNIQEMIDERKKQHEIYKKMTPPRVMTSEGEVITGKRRNVSAPEGAFVGTPVSSGVVEGYARVVFNPQDAKLNPGDILIAPFTDPGWTPLFTSVKGLVMEVGGLMTHGTVIAREYGIPAVVGVDNATTLIPDGARIRVDGTQGFVEILDEI